MKTLRTKKGFTLVEIMIVVAIIGLLAAIAIPNLLRARINANDNAVQGDLRAFSTAVESFRGAQNPPTYPANIGVLTNATPPYLDATWATANAIKHGHTFSYVPGTAAAGVIGTYAANMVFRANEAVNGYCVDHSGVIRVAADGNADGVAAGCPTANPAVV